MELLSGEDLASRLERTGPLDWREALPILSQILSGLEAAFAAGVLHRDLKAENVMLVPEASGVRAVVTDFGLAMAAEADSGAEVPKSNVLSRTRSSRAAFGTPAYMSPEQLRGEEIDHRSDIFSFGVIAYEMLSGRSPYPIYKENESLGERFARKPRSLQDFQPLLPRDLDRLVLRSLEVKTGDRPKNAAELRSAIAYIRPEAPMRRRFVFGAASAAAGGFVLIKWAPPVLEVLESWIGAPRQLPLEDYVDSAKAHEALRMGIASVTEGANIEAISHFERAIREDSKSMLARVELIETLLDLGERSKASELLTNLSETGNLLESGGTESQLLRSVRARRDENYASSLEELDVVMDQYRDDIHLSLRKGRRLEEAGRFVEGLALYEPIASESFAALLGLGRALSVTGEPRRCISLFTRQTIPVAANHESLGMMHSVLGMAYYDQGAFDDAIRHWRVSLNHRVRVKDRRGEVASLTNLARVYSRKGEVEEAERLDERALRLSREMGDRDYEAYVLGLIGGHQMRLGKLTVALDLYRQALAMESAQRDHALLAARHNGIAHAHALLGFLDEGVMNLSEARKSIDPSGQKDQQAYNYLVEGMIAAARGKFDESDQAFENSIEFYSNAAMPHQVASVQRRFSETKILRGEYGMAERMLHDASATLTALKYELELARVGLSEATLAIAQRAVKEAEVALAGAEGHLNGTPFWDSVIQRLIVRGELALAGSRMDSAIEQFRLAAERSGQSGFMELEILASIKLGQALVAQGESLKGRMALEEALETSKRMGFQPLMAMAGLGMSQLYFEAQDFASAARESADTIEVSKSMSLKPVLFRGFAVLADSHFELGRFQNAKDAYREAYEFHKALLANMKASHRRAYQDCPEISQLLARVVSRVT
jgi:tetratricopeptide (TPR) repeat protein